MCFDIPGYTAPQCLFSTFPCIVIKSPLVHSKWYLSNKISFSREKTSIFTSLKVLRNETHRNVDFAAEKGFFKNSPSFLINLGCNLEIWKLSTLSPVFFISVSHLLTSTKFLLHFLVILPSSSTILYKIATISLVLRCLPMFLSLMLLKQVEARKFFFTRRSNHRLLQI